MTDIGPVEQRAPGTPGFPSRTIVAGVAIERDVEMTTRDGVVLRADVYRPAAAAAQMPVLLLRTPYGKQMPDDATYHHPAWYARQGFIVVVQDVRGRHRSEGVFEPFVNEGRDGYDAVEWAARLPGANGRVGMYGASYPGSLQLQAAVERPPSLGAIAPAVCAADLYSHWTYEGGALNLAFVAEWAAGLALVDHLRAGDVGLVRRLGPPNQDPGPWFSSDAPIRLDPLPDAAPYYVEWLQHTTRDAFWDALGTDTRLDRLAVPTLHIAGWFDVFLAGGIEAYQKLTALGAPDQRLLVGPWAHYPWGARVGEAQMGEVGQGTGLVDRAQVRFFRRHLVGGTGLGDPPVRYFVLFGGRWASAESWPPAGAVERSLPLLSEGSANGSGGDGRLVEEAAISELATDVPPDVYNYLPTLPVPALGGHSCCWEHLEPMGSREQGPVERLAQVLVYTSEPLSAPLTIAGPVRAELWVASDAISTDYTAKLCLVNECGSWNVAEGIVRVPPPADGRDLSEPHRVTVSLRSTAVRVEPGQRLRLQVSSGTFPTWSTNPQTGAPPEQTAPADGRAAMHAVFHDRERPSRLVLTIVPEAAASG